MSTNTWIAVGMTGFPVMAGNLQGMMFRKSTKDWYEVRNHQHYIVSVSFLNVELMANLNH